MREYGQARRRDRKPQEIADNEAGDERRNAAEALAENARHDGGDARSRRRDGGRIDADEQQQRRKRHGALPRPLLKGKPRPNPTHPSQSRASVRNPSVQRPITRPEGREREKSSG